MKLWFVVLWLVPGMGWAQGQQGVPEVRSTVVVVGTPAPLTEEESPRSTETLEVQQYPLAFTDLNDLMRDDSSVDLEQRGGGGVQADLSIWGSSYEQTLVLLNGWRVNDAETSHFNLDLPVPMEMVGSVNVLHGAGSTLYGSDALSGVVDFLTAKPADGAVLKLREEGGSFGQDDQAAVASWGGKKFSEVIGGGRDFSDGFMYDRGYRSEEGSSETRVSSWLGESDVLLGGSDRSFGANQFYGNYNSTERTKEWFAGIHQQVNAKTEAVLAYRRHSDILCCWRMMLRSTRTSTTMTAGRGQCGGGMTCRGRVPRCFMGWRRMQTRSTAQIWEIMGAIAVRGMWTLN